MTRLSKSAPLLHQELVNVITSTKTSFVIMGRILSKLKDGDAYLNAIGKGIDTWDDYLAQPEIGLVRGEANRLMQIYEHFINRLGYSEEEIAKISVKNIHYLLPIIKDLGPGDIVDGLVQDAIYLTQRDFRERIYDVKTNESGERTYTYMIMRKCVETGNLTKVHDIDSDTIKSKFRLSGT